MKFRVLLSVLTLVLLNACAAIAPLPAGAGSADPPQPNPTALLETTTTPTNGPLLPVGPSPFPETPTATQAFKPSITPFPTATPTPTWISQGPYKIICPILLYHRIAVHSNGNIYYIAPDDFKAQMQALKDWGYTTIPVTLLVKALNFGAELPARPIIISFDDGDETVYSQAFPIMQELGFTGVNYIVYNYVGAEGYMNVDQIKALAASGWETGSHSLSHIDLTASKHLEWEIIDSRHYLEKMLGVRVETFAYPFGKVNGDVRSIVRDNYRAGMGLGVYLTQRSADIYYMWRRPVEPGWDLKEFGSFLPWNSPLQP